MDVRALGLTLAAENSLLEAEQARERNDTDETIKLLVEAVRALSKAVEFLSRD